VNNQSEIVIYQSDDGRIRLETRLENETLWMTQSQMAELFQTTQQNIILRIQNIYEEGELTPNSTHKKSLWVRQEGHRQVEREHLGWAHLVIHHFKQIILVCFVCFV